MNDLIYILIIGIMLIFISLVLYKYLPKRNFELSKDNEIFEEINITRLSDLESYIKKYLSNYFLILENINNKSNKKV